MKMKMMAALAVAVVAGPVLADNSHNEQALHEPFPTLPRRFWQANLLVSMLARGSIKPGSSPTTRRVASGPRNSEANHQFTSLRACVLL